MIGVIKIVATIKINAANLFIFFQIFYSTQSVNPLLVHNSKSQRAVDCFANRPRKSIVPLVQWDFCGGY